MFLTVYDAFKNCLMPEEAIEGINAHIYIERVKSPNVEIDDSL